MNLFFLSPSGAKGFARSHEELRDGQAYRVTHTATAQAVEAFRAGRPEKVEQLILSNGSFTGSAVLRPLVDGIVGLAGRHGRKLEITTYDDPMTGSTAYGQSYRTERFIQVIGHQRDRRRIDTDHPISLGGQSRGWITIAQAAHALYQGEQFDSLTGLAPVGHTPRDIEVNPHDVLEILGKTLDEIRDPRAQQKDFHAFRVKAGIARNAIAHTVGNAVAGHSLNPVSAIRRATLPMFNEVKEILTTDVTPEVVELSKNVGRLTLIACRYDRYAPGEEIVNRFADIPEFAGTAVLLDTPHNGTLLDSQLVPELYQILV